MQDEKKQPTLAVEAIELQSKDDFDKQSGESGERGASKLEHTITSVEAQTAHNVALFDADGHIVLQPAASRDPKDPLNMTLRHKLLCCGALCFFGALAAAAELILGAMLPVFSLEYAGLDPKLLLPFTQNPNFLPAGSDPLKALQNLGGPPIWKIYLLASLPILVIGVANLALVPLAISMGRRAIVLATGVLAIVGCLWAGNSHSLESHLAARCVQAIGAGTVESLIPFIIQDMVHVHKRNTWMAGVFAAQGIIIIVLGFSSPYIIIYLSWRWVYFMTAAGAGFFIIGVYFFMPETRWPRTRDEMNGIPRADANVEYTPRTWAWDLAFFHGPKEWRKGWNAFLDTMRTFFYPQIFFITMLHSAMMAATLAAAYTVAANLLVKPWSWSFLSLGFCLVPVLIAAILIIVVTGSFADYLANLMAKKRGRRLPENQLVNLIIPVISALIGCILFGITGEDPSKYSWALFLFALGLMAFGFLGANAVGAVYVLETYPHLAGKTMNIYTGIMAAFAALIPVVYVYGPAWKRRWPADKYGDY